MKGRFSRCLYYYLLWTNSLDGWPIAYRSLPNSAVALRLLKQIVGKYPDIIQQGFGAGLEEASRFQAFIRKLASAELHTVPHKAALLGFKRFYQEVLLSSRAAKIGLLSALTKRFETACDPINPEAGDLKLLYFCTQVASALPLTKMHELLVLLRPIHQMIGQHGDTVLAAIKHSQPKGSSAKQRTACIAMVYLLLLNNFLIQRYSVTRDRLTALEESAEKRKLEENRELQVSAMAGERLVEADGLEAKDLPEQYTGLKLLLHTFGQASSFPLSENSDSGGQSDASLASTSPVAVRTPLWALNSSDLARAGSGKLLKQRNSSTGKTGPGKAAVQRRKSNLSRSLPQKKRRKSGFNSNSDSGSEQEQDLEEKFVKRAARSRRRLEADMDND